MAKCENCLKNGEGDTYKFLYGVLQSVTQAGGPQSAGGVTITTREYRVLGTGSSFICNKCTERRFYLHSLLPLCVSAVCLVSVASTLALEDWLKLRLGSNSSWFFIGFGLLPIFLAIPLLAHGVMSRDRKLKSEKLAIRLNRERIHKEYASAAKLNLRFFPSSERS
jgi:hypothetical protein